MMNAQEIAKNIKTNMPVICSEDGQFAVVDHDDKVIEIKLKKDDSGKHHFIPSSWIKSIDQKSSRRSSWRPGHERVAYR